MNKDPVVIVGAGPVGLVSALYLARVRKLPVIVVERQSVVGGLYASIDTPWGVVDQGAHIPQETGISDIDELFFDALPRDEWQLLEGTHKDIAGNIFAGQIDFGSLYPDLRRLPKQDYRQCAAELFSNLSPTYAGFNEASNLRVYFEARFGAFCTNTVFAPIARKIWGQPLERMSPWAAKLVHLARVVTHNMETSLQLKMSPVLDQVIGFPDQLSVPAEVFCDRSRAMYPIQFGLRRVVTGFVRELELEGVRILTSTETQGIDTDENNISAIHLKYLNTGATERKKVSAIVWTSPIPALATLLGLKASPMPDAPVPHRVVHLFLNRPPASEKLYWLWSYDPGDCLVRVSIPHAYCINAASTGIYPVCAEIHVPASEIGDEAAIKLAESQLRMRALIDPDTKVLGSAVLHGIGSFFIPTIDNCQAMHAQRQAIDVIRPNNLLIATQDINAGIFYMPDILRAGKFQLDRL